MTPSRWAIAGFLLLALAVRLAFGLTTAFWSEDEREIYLIGLQYFTTGVWPDFGPDVVYTHTQVPGGLQGLLVGGPLYLWQQPETPFVLLALLSTAALGVLGWYISRRVPDVPRWFLWVWIFTCPWALDVSTTMLNTSYLLFGAVLFFVSAIDVIAPGPRRVLSDPLAFFLMGVGMLWVYQLHMSFPVLLPFLAVAIWRTWQRRHGRGLGVAIGCCAAGALFVASTLIPTLLHVGLAPVLSASRTNIQFEPSNLTRLPEVIARFFSFGSYELPRFLGTGSPERFGFLRAHPIAAPFAVFAALIGILQALILAGAVFFKHAAVDWRAIRNFTLGTLGLIALSFAFSVKGPASHALYVVFPIVMIYSFYVWVPFFRFALVRRLAAALLVAGAITHVAIARDSLRTNSLYTNRPLIVRAIQERDYLLLGERRPDIWRKAEENRK